MKSNKNITNNLGNINNSTNNCGSVEKEGYFKYDSDQAEPASSNINGGVWKRNSPDNAEVFVGGEKNATQNEGDRSMKIVNNVHDLDTKERSTMTKKMKVMICTVIWLLVPLYLTGIVALVLVTSQQDGGWSDWGSWTPCSQSEGTGIRSRYRYCDNPLPSAHGRQCLGNTEQFSLCNNQTSSSNGTDPPPKILWVTNGGQKGQWSPAEFCPKGTFASGYNMKIQKDQGTFGDNTALNSIRLICTSQSAPGNFYITSGEGPSGDWIDNTFCPDGHFLVAFSLQVEPANTGVNFVKFRCRDMAGRGAETELVQYPGHGLWGSWGASSDTCGAHSAICGLSTRVQPDQGLLGDDTALNDVIFSCCLE